MSFIDKLKGLGRSERSENAHRQQVADPMACYSNKTHHLDAKADIKTVPGSQEADGLHDLDKGWLESCADALKHEMEDGPCVRNSPKQQGDQLLAATKARAMRP